MPDRLKQYNAEPPDAVNQPLADQGGSSLSFKEKIILESGDIRSANYIAGVQGWRISNTAAEFNQTITTGAIDIGGADTSSFHVDSSGNMWLGAATFAAGPFRVTSAGAVTATNITITGGSVDGGLLTASSVTAAKLSVSTLSAISANLGTITAGSLDAVTVTAATITGSTLQTGTTGENVNITASKISVRNDTTETGYFRGYQTTDRYGVALNNSEIDVDDVKAVRMHVEGLRIQNGGGGGTLDYAWLYGITAAGGNRNIALIASVVLLSGDTTGGSAAILDLGSTNSDLRIRTTAGAPSGGASGSVALDTTNSRAYFNVGGTWKYAALI